MKLTLTQRREIIRRARAGEPYAAIAQDFGVTDRAVSMHAINAGIRRRSYTSPIGAKPVRTTAATAPKFQLLVTIPADKLSAVLTLDGIELHDLCAA